MDSILQAFMALLKKVSNRSIHHLSSILQFLSLFLPLGFLRRWIDSPRCWIIYLRWIIFWFSYVILIFFLSFCQFYFYWLLYFILLFYFCQFSSITTISFLSLQEQHCWKRWAVSPSIHLSFFSDPVVTNNSFFLLLCSLLVDGLDSWKLYFLYLVTDWTLGNSVSPWWLFNYWDCLLLSYFFFFWSFSTFCLYFWCIVFNLLYWNSQKNIFTKIVCQNFNFKVNHQDWLFRFNTTFNFLHENWISLEFNFKLYYFL